MIPRLHLITDDEVLHRGEFPRHAEGAMEAGGDRVALHLRGPACQARFLLRLAERLHDAAVATGSSVLANDRVDLALVLPWVTGVHLGQRSLPPATARRLLGPGRVLGLSVHGVQEVPEAAATAPDFLIVGAVYSTTSHPDRVPGGAQRVREVSGASPLPLIAIGGVAPGRVAEVMAAGALGVAVRSGVWDEPDPRDSVLEYLAELDRWAGPALRKERTE